MRRRLSTLMALLMTATVVLAVTGEPAGAVVTCPISQLTTGFGASSLSISDDGTRIAFSSRSDPAGQNSDGNAEIFRYDTTTGTYTQITATTGGSSGQAAISGDGTRIAFLSNRDLTGDNADANVEVFVHTGGTTFVQATETTGSIFLDQLSIDEDGDRLAWRSGRNFTGQNPDNDSEIFRHAVNTGTTTQISDLFGSLDQGDSPAISDDGTLVAYSDNISVPDPTPGGGGNDHYEDVYVFNATSGQTANASNLNTPDHTGELYFATLAGNGTRVAFATDLDPVEQNDDGNHEIFLRDLPTSTTSQLTDSLPEPGTSIGTFALDDSGSRLAFVTERNLNGANPDQSDEIFLREASGTITALTTGTGGSNSAPKISGDGNRVIFLSTRNYTGGNPGGLFQLFLADCGGTPPPAPARPDGLLRLGTQEAFRGGNVYNPTGAGQTRTVNTARGATATFAIRVQNDRVGAMDSFRVRGAAGNTQAFRVRYYAGATEITAQVVAGTYAVNDVPAGGTRTITMKVTVKAAAARGANLSRLVTITSVADGTKKDAVKVIVRRA